MSAIMLLFLTACCVVFGCSAVSSGSCMFRHTCVRSESRLSCRITVGKDCAVVSWGGAVDKMPNVTSLVLTRRIPTGQTIDLIGLPDVITVTIKVVNQFDIRTSCELFAQHRDILVNRLPCIYHDVSRLYILIKYALFTPLS
jgi:hypothetical protein